MQILISWLLQKPTDLDLHCLQRQCISGLSRTRVKWHLILFLFAAFCLCQMWETILWNSSLWKEGSGILWNTLSSGILYTCTLCVNNNSVPTYKLKGKDSINSKAKTQWFCLIPMYIKPSYAVFQLCNGSGGVIAMSRMSKPKLRFDHV